MSEERAPKKFTFPLQCGGKAGVGGEVRGLPAFRRRRFLAAGAALVAFPCTSLAQQCRVTPRDQLGPFYKSAAPQQAELCASGSGGKERLIVTGHVLGLPDCKPLAGALVEVWQADARYAFNTILPGEYPGRPRHIHYRISHKGYATLVTQLYFARERGIPERLVVTPARNEKSVALATFDITLARA